MCVFVLGGRDGPPSLQRGTSFSFASSYNLSPVSRLVWELEEGTVGLGAHAVPELQQAHD